MIKAADLPWLGAPFVALLVLVWVSAPVPSVKHSRLGLATTGHSSYSSLAQSDMEFAGRTRPVSMSAKVAEVLVAEYNLGRAYAREVTQAAYSAAYKHGVDPLLILALAGNESRFQHIGNPSGGDDPRYPYGIMQVAGKWHPEKFEGGVVVKTSLAENIDLGTKVIKEYLDKERGDEKRALLRYNGSLSSGEEGYFYAVRKVKNRLKERLSGQ